MAYILQMKSSIYSLKFTTDSFLRCGVTRGRLMLKNALLSGWSSVYLGLEAVKPDVQDRFGLGMGFLMFHVL